MRLTICARPECQTSAGCKCGSWPRITMLKDSAETYPMSERELLLRILFELRELRVAVKDKVSNE